MTQVEDLWNIKKVGQTRNFKDIRGYVLTGRCCTGENIKFIYNDSYYNVNFHMYFSYDAEIDKIMYENAIIENIRIDKYVNRTRSYDVTYDDDDQIRNVDLSDMTNKLSKALRASKYAIEKLFSKKVRSWDPDD